MMCLGNGRRREGMTAGLLFVPLASLWGETCHIGLWEAGDDTCSCPRIAVCNSAFAVWLVCHWFI